MTPPSTPAAPRHASPATTPPGHAPARTPTRLSIVVLTCNQRDTTMRLCDSLTGYMREHNDAELIIVDNGSSDGTAGHIAAWINNNGLQRVTVMPLPVNKGVAAGRNVGLRHATGRYVMLLDNDTLACGETFDALVSHLEDNPGCGVVAPALYSPDGELQSSAKPYPTPWLKLMHVLRPGHELAVERRHATSPHPYYVIGACQLFPRSLLDTVGMLDEGMFYGPEDCDYCLRVRLAGYSIDYRSDLSLVHDWRRATRRSPLGWLGRRHAAALWRLWRRTWRYRNL